MNGFLTNEANYKKCPGKKKEKIEHETTWSLAMRRPIGPASPEMRSASGQRGWRISLSTLSLLLNLFSFRNAVLGLGGRWEESKIFRKKLSGEYRQGVAIAEHVVSVKILIIFLTETSSRQDFLDILSRSWLQIVEGESGCGRKRFRTYPTCCTRCNGQSHCAAGGLSSYKDFLRRCSLKMDSDQEKHFVRLSCLSPCLSVQCLGSG